MLSFARLPSARRSAAGVVVAAALTVVVTAAGCASKTAPDYSRPMDPNARALRLVPPDQLPDLATAWRSRDAGLTASLDESLRWFSVPSSKQRYPYRVERWDGNDEISHAEAKASVEAFRQLLQSSGTAAEFVEEVRRRFDVYESIGWDGSGTVLFTGYFAPEFDASPVRTAQYASPIYRRPPSLVTADDGTPLGRRDADGKVVPWPPRGEIEQSGLLQGLELYWMKTPLDAYIVQVNGSAKLRLPDGSIRHIGYAGKTDRPYFGLGKAMVEAGLIEPNRLSLAEIRRVYRENPAEVERLMARNESFVFFADYDGKTWPAGSLGVRVTPRASIATDKKVYPPGCVAMVDTRGGGEQGAPLQRFMMDQDTGGAIQAPGRCDLFMGIGPSAEILAGGQYAEGRLYYLFLKPDGDGKG